MYNKDNGEWVMGVQNMGVTRALRTKRESYKGKGERRGVCSNIYTYTHREHTM